jgi:hypothetical protein
MKPTLAGEYEVEQQCRAAGYNEKDTRLIVLRTAGGCTAAQAAQRLDRSPSWAKRREITAAIELWRAGKPIGNRLHLVAIEPQPAPSDTGDGWRLDTLAGYARGEIKRVAHRRGEVLLGGQFLQTAIKQGGAAAVVDLVKRYPSTLLQPEGRLLLKGLVDLLEAANTGNPARRVAGLLPEGKGKCVARSAQAALTRLGKPLPGEALNYPPEPLARLVDAFRNRVAQLQAEFQAMKGDNLLARIRGAHPDELRAFKTETELATVLRGDPLTVAAGLAEKATGVSAETFQRTWREYKKHLWQIERAEKARKQAEKTRNP